MKRIIRIIGSATLLGGMLIAPHSVIRAEDAAETVTTTETTTSAGTISEFAPEAIVIRRENSSEPLRYSYTKSTTFVDENGAPVSMALVKSGLPVTIYYTRDGDRLVASRVIVRRHAEAVPPDRVIEKKTTTTTTTDK